MVVFEVQEEVGSTKKLCKERGALYAEGVLNAEEATAL